MKTTLKDWGDNSGKLLVKNKDQHLIPITHTKAPKPYG